LYINFNFSGAKVAHACVSLFHTIKTFSLRNDFSHDSPNFAENFNEQT